jgi:hypothetical protein
MWEQAFAKFLFDALIALVGLAGGALALWTWQKGYWEYQLRRQTEDWKSRQSYARKEARRQAMELLLTELNEAVEGHLIATYHTISAMVRQEQYRQAHPEAGVAPFQEQVDEQVIAFNASEREWLVQSAVLGGKLRLHFAGIDPKVLQMWPTLGERMITFCELLNRQELAGLHAEVVTTRNEKDELLQKLQAEIDRFTESHLDLPAQSK